MQIYTEVAAPGWRGLSHEELLEALLLFSAAHPDQVLRLGDLYIVGGAIVSKEAVFND